MKIKSMLIAAALLATPTAFASGHAHWSYSGHTSPGHWGDMEEDFQTCKLGLRQSPIDIKTKSVEKAGLAPLDFAYTAGSAEATNNGHTIQINLPAAGTVTVDQHAYTLVQFHFHTPSEEKINGKAYPLVAHMVHKDADGKLAVVAVLFKQGKENAALKPVFAHLPHKEGQTAALGADFDPTGLLPANRAYYAFSGSLTTPPCSEDVTWRILKTPVEMSAAQLHKFQALYKMNARPVQPLNGRVVQEGGQ